MSLQWVILGISSDPIWNTTDESMHLYFQLQRVGTMDLAGFL